MVRFELEKQIEKQKTELKQEKKNVVSRAEKSVPEAEKLKPLNESQEDAVSSMKKMQEQTRNAVEEMQNTARNAIEKMNAIPVSPTAGEEKQP